MRVKFNVGDRVIYALQLNDLYTVVATPNNLAGDKKLPDGYQYVIKGRDGSERLAKEKHLIKRSD